MNRNAPAQTIQETLERTTQSVKNTTQWNVQFAKFFNFPSSETLSSSLLRPMSSAKKCRLKGTWVTSSSSNVSLRIDNSLNQPTLLIVSLGESIYEEHYASKLDYIWPQGSCRSEYSLRGSRVIFATYRDGNGHVQKFAMRFTSSGECQKFMELLKPLKERREVDLPFAMMSSSFSQGVEGVNRELVPYTCSQQAAFGHTTGSTDVALPDSFTALLADCCTAADSGEHQAPAEFDLKRFLEEGISADKPFIDLLEKMDHIIVALSGDLKLRSIGV